MKDVARAIARVPARPGVPDVRLEELDSRRHVREIVEAPAREVVQDPDAHLSGEERVHEM